MRRGLAFALLVVASVCPAAAEELDDVAQAAITRYRQQHGLSAVKSDPKLVQLAQEQAHAMARADNLDHSVDKPFAARMVRYDPEIAVENIAAGTRDFSSTLEVWKRSAGHNANLLKRGATRFGIAVAHAPQSKYKVYWALIMAGPHAPRGVRTASAPGMMRAAPSWGSAARARAPASGDGNSDLLSGLARALRPLWSGVTGNTKTR